MKTVVSLAAAAAIAFLASPAAAVSINVNNYSFEILPTGGLPYTGCGVGCAYSYTAAPGWVLAGQGGQFQPGSPANTAYFASVPDGTTVAWASSGTYYQTVAPLAQAGRTYKLQVDVGMRYDAVAAQWVGLNFANTNTTIYATGLAPASGGWSTFTSTFTVGAADAGSAITIVLNGYGQQGNWDNVRLSVVPEPASWALMITGFGMIGATMRRRKALAA